MGLILSIDQEKVLAVAERLTVSEVNSILAVLLFHQVNYHSMMEEQNYQIFQEKSKTVIRMKDSGQIDIKECQRELMKTMVQCVRPELLGWVYNLEKKTFCDESQGKDLIVLPYEDGFL